MKGDGTDWTLRISLYGCAAEMRERRDERSKEERGGMKGRGWAPADKGMFGEMRDEGRGHLLDIKSGHAGKGGQAKSEGRDAVGPDAV
jgi:hypothetical protein